jgi:hypothetical protein
VVAKEERRADALAQVQVLRDRGYRSITRLAKVPKHQAAEQHGARVVALSG